MVVEETNRPLHRSRPAAGGHIHVRLAINLEFQGQNTNKYKNRFMDTTPRILVKIDTTNTYEIDLLNIIEIAIMFIN